MSVARVAGATIGLMIVACGGKAVVDAGGPGAGGNAAGGTSMSGGIAGSNVVGNGGSTSGPGGSGACTDDTNGQPKAMQGDCQAACEILFCCGVSGECPGFQPSDKAVFVEGCIPGCQDNAALIAVVNGENCSGTVSVIRGANPEFNDSCENGISGTSSTSGSTGSGP